MTPDLEEKIIRINNNDMNEIREILGKQKSNPANKPMNLKDEILKNKRESPVVLSEGGSHDNSRMVARIRIKKDIQIDLCHYNSEARTNPNDSFFDKSNRPTNDVIDKDPNLRDVNFYQPEDNDYFEMEKATYKQPDLQKFEDEELIDAETPVGQAALDVAGYKEDKPVPPANEPQEAPHNSIFFNPEERANKKITDEEKGINEFKELMNKSKVEKKDIKEQINDITSYPFYEKKVEDDITSNDSANKMIKKVIQQEYEQYNSEGRSVCESVFNQNMEGEDARIEVDPKIADVEI